MILKTILFIFTSIIILVGIMLIIGISNPKHSLDPSDYPWVSQEDFNPGKTADSLVARMSFDEKINQLNGDGGIISSIRMGVRFVLFKNSKPFPIFYSGLNKRLEIPPIAFSDGPRGVTVSHSTAFPVAMARGASWDVELEKRIADAMGKELRASNSNYFGGLCINLLRHPAWGRAQETYSEDPYMLGKMGVALLEGVQKHNVMACAKHFAANSIENARFYVDVQMDERTLHEVYLPHFKRVVDADVASVMSAYNKFNGEFCGHNSRLLTQILRKEWGFEGFVISDFVWGVHEAGAGIKAGMDIEMPVANHYKTKKVKALIEQGILTQDQIDDRVQTVLKRKLQFISRPDPMDYKTIEIAGPEHTKLALEAAEKSMVLLKNENKTLPLEKSSLRKLAVIGHLADEINTGDHGSSYVKPPYVTTALKGIEKYLNGDVEVVFNDGKDIQSAIKDASEADAVVLVVGYQYNDEGEYVIPDPSKEGARAKEGGDRESLTLKTEDEYLIRRVGSENNNTVVVIVCGSAVIMENWKASVPSILVSWYAGMEGGTALANILFGKVNPSGKLPFTIPTDEDHLPSFDPFTREIEYGYYHGYTLLDKKRIQPVYPFGFGLSYTQYNYDSLTIINPTLSGNETLVAEVSVSNAGNMDGEEVVQLYVGFENSSVDRPVKLLRGFQKISLLKGETKKLLFEVPAKDLAWYNPETSQWEIEEMEYSLYAGGSASNEELLVDSFKYSTIKLSTP